jgi:hypothetical protein
LADKQKAIMMSPNLLCGRFLSHRARNVSADAGPNVKPTKIKFGEMREMGIRGVLVRLSRLAFDCGSADRWPDDMRLSDIEQQFTCKPAARAARM